MWVQEVAVIN